MRVILSIITTLSLARVVNDNIAIIPSDTVSYEYEKVLDEIVIHGISENKILKKARNNIFDLGKEYSDFFWGNGQHTQVVECSGKTIQLSREYGFFVNSGYHIKTPKGDEFDNLAYFSNFIPVYNARSLHYGTSTDNVLSRNYLTLEGSSYDKKNGYDALRKYVFEIMRYVCKYGPLFTPLRQYDYTLASVTESEYCFRFISSDRSYPQKNPINARGTLVIDKRTGNLKEIRIDEMEFLFARYIKIKRNVAKYKHSQAKAENCVFRFNEFSEPFYAIINMVWDDTLSDFADQNCQPRPQSASYNCRVTEYWQNDTYERMSLDCFVRKIGNPLYIGHLRNCRFPLQSLYDEESVNNIKWMTDVKQYEIELSRRQPINQQYLQQSQQPFDKLDDISQYGTGEIADALRKQRLSIEEYETIKKILFKEP